MTGNAVAAEEEATSKEQAGGSHRNSWSDLELPLSCERSTNALESLNKETVNALE